MKDGFASLASGLPLYLRLKFRPTTEQIGWRYIPRDHAVAIPSRLLVRIPDRIWEGMDPEDRKALRKAKEWSREDLFCLLHELGHAHHRHVVTHDPAAALRQEREAWEYAGRCVRPEHREALRRYAERCLKTYERR